MAAVVVVVIFCHCHFMIIIALPFALTGSFGWLAGVKAASLQLLGGHVCLQRTSPAAAAVVLLSFSFLCLLDLCTSSHHHHWVSTFGALLLLLFMSVCRAVHFVHFISFSFRFPFPFLSFFLSSLSPFPVQCCISMLSGSSRFHLIFSFQSLFSSVRFRLPAACLCLSVCLPVCCVFAK